MAGGGPDLDAARPEPAERFGKVLGARGDVARVLRVARYRRDLYPGRKVVDESLAIFIDERDDGLHERAEITSPGCRALHAKALRTVPLRWCGRSSKAPGRPQP